MHLIDILDVFDLDGFLQIVVLFDRLPEEAPDHVDVVGRHE